MKSVLPCRRIAGTAVDLTELGFGAAVFDSGLLSRGRPAPGLHYGYQAAPPQLRERVARLAELCEAFGTTLPAAAPAFPFTHPTVVNVTVGVRTAAEVARNVGLLRRPVPAGLRAALPAEVSSAPRLVRPNEPVTGRRSG